jgi:hypothetical protein
MLGNKRKNVRLMQDSGLRITGTATHDSSLPAHKPQIGNKFGGSAENSRSTIDSEFWIERPPVEVDGRR